MKSETGAAVAAKEMNTKKRNLRAVNKKYAFMNPETGAAVAAEESKTSFSPI